MNSKHLLFMIIAVLSFVGCNNHEILSKAQRHTIKSHKPTEPIYFEILYLNGTHADLVCIIRLKRDPNQQQEFNRHVLSLAEYTANLPPKIDQSQLIVLAANNTNPVTEIPVSSHPYWTKYGEAAAPSFEEIDTYWQRNIQSVLK